MGTLLLIVHVGAATIWFGHKLTIPSDILRSLAAGDDHARLMVRRMRVVGRLGIGSAVVTILTGGALLSRADWTASAVLGLGIMAAIAAGAVGALVARPAWNGVAASVDRGDRVTAAAFGRRFGRALTLESALWLAALWAMVVG